MAGDIDRSKVTTTEGQLLLLINDKMDFIKSQDNRIGELEMTVTRSVAVVESVNNAISDFVRAMKTMEEKNIDMALKHQNMMKDIAQLLEQMVKNESRIKEIENAQRNGCPSSLNARERISLEMKHQEEKIQLLAVANGKNRDEINELNKAHGVNEEQISVANNRIKDLEAFQNKATWSLLGGGATIILMLISNFANMFKH